METHIKERLYNFLYKVIDLFFAGIICVIVSSLITTSILENIEMNSKNKERLALLSSICIGSNRAWVDESFGTPQFISNKDEYLLCAYTTDHFLLQVVYDGYNAVQGYLVTAFEDDKVQIKDLPAFFDKGIEIGRFSFYDFPSTPTNVLGFISNGASRALYSETYYLGSSGNYLEYHIAFFDYGFVKGDHPWGFFEESEADNEMTVDQLSPNAAQIITNRTNSYPNTYGVSVLGLDMEHLLFTYDWFDSLKLLVNQSYK